MEVDERWKPEPLAGAVSLTSLRCRGESRSLCLCDEKPCQFPNSPARLLKPKVGLSHPSEVFITSPLGRLRKPLSDFTAGGWVPLSRLSNELFVMQPFKSKHRVTAVCQVSTNAGLEKEYTREGARKVTSLSF